MSIIKDLQKLHYSFYIILVSVILMPFIYASIYFFNRSFYNQADKDILLVVTFILSFLIFVFLFIINDLSSEVLDEIEKPSKEKTFEEKLINKLAFSVIANIFWITPLDFIFYTIQRFSGFSMIYYFHVLLYFFPSLVFGYEYLINVNRLKKNKRLQERINKIIDCEISAPPSSPYPDGTN